MIIKEILIKNKYDKMLSVLLEYPENEITDYIIINHCFTCSKNYKIYNNISKTLVENGYGVIRFDMMGLGESEGKFEHTNFSTNIEDLTSVYNYISANYKPPKFLIGHSLGGLITIRSTHILSSIKSIAIIGTPYNLDGLLSLFSKYKETLETEGSADMKIAGRDFKIGKHFLDDIKDKDIEKDIITLSKPIIIFHSNRDRTVSYNHGLKLFNSIKSPKSFITLQNANHLVSNQSDCHFIGNLLVNWFDKNK